MKVNGLILAVLIHAASCPLFADYVWEDLEKGDLLWDAPVGLWSSVDSADSSNRIHNSRFCAGNLLLAARYGLAGEPQVELVLQALHDMQDSYGSIKTQYEDAVVRDGNVSFFVCTPLLLLRHVYSSELSTNSLRILDDIFLSFYNRFYDRSTRLFESNVYYPNAFLGDLTCAKLIQEHFSITGDEADALRLKMLEAAEYWRDNEWGWGEHMSDVYGMVCVDLISEYLLLTVDHPSQIFTEYVDLLAELLFIEDSYGGNPRVPAIRSYAFAGRSTQTNYRDEIKPWDDVVMGSQANHLWRNGYLLHDLFTTLGWHSAIEPLQNPAATNVAVSCYDGTVATAIIEEDIRLGSMSRYPIMPEAEHITWGLLWQSFPVAFWKPDGDWAFLQWQAVENRATNAHPVNVSGAAPALTSTVDPPLFGTTHSFQKDGNVLTVRIMPEMADSWSSVSDQFKILNCTAAIADGPSDSSFSQLLLTYPERTVSVGFSSLTTSSSTALRYEGNAAYWGVTYPSNQLAEAGMIVDLFGISLNGAIEQSPVITVMEPADSSRTLAQQKREILWYWPDGAIWKAVVDPLAENVLEVVDAGMPEGLVTFSSRRAVLNDADDSSIMTNGDHVAAGNVYGGAVDPVVNGIAFKQLNFSKSVAESNVTLKLYDLGGTVGYTFSDATDFYTANVDMAELMAKNYLGAYYSNGIGITFSNLTVGATYQLQGFYWDKASGSIQYIRDAGNVTNRSLTFPVSAAAGGYSWVAIWVADAPVKSFEVCPGPSSRALLSGLSLRAISETPYAEWLSRYPGVGSAVNGLDDPDGDNLNNLYEWGLGGNPDDADDMGHVPTFGRIETGGFEYVYARRSDAAALGLIYYLEQTPSLISGTWTNGNVDVVGTGMLNSEFDIVTNRMKSFEEDQQFLRLIIERN